jgi:O-acetyl-ADP-ribose deacetylase (regulator of RNase III)
MIQYVKGNLFESTAEALINTVNLVGVMGKCIALQFKQLYPNNYAIYKKACKNQSIGIGKLLVTKECGVFGEKIIINFPTKTDWHKPSEYEYIESGLTNLIQIISTYNIKSIAIPPLGAGNGGLHWTRVKHIIENKLSILPDVAIYVYEPNTPIIEQARKERVKLTPARALLLYVLFDLVRHGEHVSEFSCEKVCYFLQKFGGSHLFKLTYTPQYYGPYSGKVRYVLNAINGSYISGYSDMNKRPFDTLFLIPDSYNEIKTIVESSEELRTIANRTCCFLTGYYSDFGLELLSSVDFIMHQHQTTSIDYIYDRLKEWNHRKSLLFSEKRYVDIACNHILNHTKAI